LNFYCREANGCFQFWHAFSIFTKKYKNEERYEQIYEGKEKLKAFIQNQKRQTF